VLGDLSTVFDSLLQRLMQVLPGSPFTPFIAQFAQLPYLGYLNWFFPVSECLVVMSAWLVAVALFYLYSIAMRWVKLIGSS